MTKQQVKVKIDEDVMQAIIAQLSAESYFTVAQAIEIVIGMAIEEYGEGYEQPTA